jgi:RNA polymerase sigma factor (TIGR02999 family)
MTPSEPPLDITRLLASLETGDRESMDRLFSLVYDELHRIARLQRRKGGSPETLNTTAIVHEAYLKLFRSERVAVKDRTHFFAVAARAMRQILVDHARARLARKRGGGEQPVALDEAEIPVDARAAEILELDRALDRLAGVDERLGRVVELRYFAGLSVEESAEVLAVHARTVKKDWRKARAFLHRELGHAPAS